MKALGKEDGTSDTPSIVYYKTSTHCPRVGDEGKAVLYKVMFDEPVWIMHPALLSEVKRLAQQEGFSLVEFDVDAFVRRQCTNLAMQYLDMAMEECHGRISGR